MAEQSITPTDLRALRSEIKMAEKLNETELEPRVLEALSRYTGKYVPSMAKGWSILLNEVYPVIQYNLPSIFFRNPKVFLKPRTKYYITNVRNPRTGRIEPMQMDSMKSATTQEALLNYELEEIRYKEEVRKVLLDALLFPHGVLWHGYKGNFGMTEERSFYIQDEQIFVRRICPLYFLKDPAVSIENIDEARWTGRSFWIPLRDLLEDDQLDVDKKKLKGLPGYQTKVADPKTQSTAGQDVKVVTPLYKPLLDYSDPEFKAGVHSKFVLVYEIFQRPTKKEKREGKKGRVVLLIMEQERALRVNSWDYKAEGWPGKCLQFNPVPENQFGLSDLDVYKSECDHKNLVINQQIRNAEQLNKVWVAISKEGATEEDIQKVLKGENTVVTFESGNAKDRMFVATAGTNSSELYLLDQRIQQSLQDKSGVTDLKRGVLQSGEESKYSVQQRTAGGGVRPAYRQDLMAEFLRGSCKYILQLLKQYLPLQDAVRIIGSLDIQWSDEFTKEEIQAETDVELDVNSMAPENPEKEMAELQAILTLMFEAMNNPTITQKIGQEGMIFNISPIIEQLLMRMKIRDPDVFRAIRPEESEGYVAVKDVRDAKENVTAALQGQPPPVPPQEGQDNKAHLEIYSSIQQILAQAGQVSDVLEMLIQAHVALLQEKMDKEAPKTPTKAPSLTGTKSQVQSVGAA